MRRSTSIAVGLTAAFAVAALGAFAEKPGAGDQSDVRELMLQKRDLLQQRVSSIEQSYLMGRAAHAEVFEAKADLIRSQLDLAASHSERVEILEAQVQLFQGLEQIAQSNFGTGQATHHELLKTKANLIDAKIALMLEKQ